MSKLLETKYLTLPENQYEATEFSKQLNILNPETCAYFLETYSKEMLEDFYSGPNSCCIQMEIFKDGVKLYHTEVETDYKVLDIKTYIRKQKLERILNDN